MRDTRGDRIVTIEADIQTRTAVRPNVSQVGNPRRVVIGSAGRSAEK